MKKKSVRAMLTIALLMSIMAPFASAEEKIIQQEDISFEKCVNVITISEDKLSIAPENVGK